MARGVILALLALLITQGAHAPAPKVVPGVFTRLPIELKLKNHTYPIRYVGEFKDNKGTILMGETNYAIDPQSKETALHYIKISTVYSKPEIESTVIHEMLHAIAHEQGFPLSEKQVLQLEAGIFDAFKRNGWKIEVK